MKNIEIREDSLKEKLKHRLYNLSIYIIVKLWEYINNRKVSVEDTHNGVFITEVYNHTLKNLSISEANSLIDRIEKINEDLVSNYKADLYAVKSRVISIINGEGNYMEFNFSSLEELKSKLLDFRTDSISTQIYLSCFLRCNRNEKNIESFYRTYTIGNAIDEILENGDLLLSVVNKKVKSLEVLY